MADSLQIPIQILTKEAISEIKKFTKVAQDNLNSINKSTKQQNELLEEDKISSGQDFNPTTPSSLYKSGLKCLLPSESPPVSSSAGREVRSLPLQGNKLPDSQVKERLSNSSTASRIEASSLLAVSIVYEKLTMCTSV